MPVDSAPAKLALTLEEAAQTLGISSRHFRRHVLPELKILRIRTAVRIPVGELERYVRESGTVITDLRR